MIRLSHVCGLAAEKKWVDEDFSALADGLNEGIYTF